MKAAILAAVVAVAALSQTSFDSGVAASGHTFVQDGGRPRLSKADVDRLRAADDRR
jgi:hypothetical protein